MRTKPGRRRVGLIGAAIAFLTALPIWAAINYGSFMGNGVTFVDVTETAVSAGDAEPLFNAPTVSTDALDFNPAGMSSSVSGAGSDSTIGRLDFAVQAKAGFFIEEFVISESGSTTLVGNVAPGSMATSSFVQGSGTLDIVEVDFAPITPISVPFALTFNPSGGTYFLGTDGGGGPSFNTQWSGSVTLPVEAVLIANSVVFTGGATKIIISATNSLGVTAETGTSASITKADFDVRAETGTTGSVTPTATPTPTPSMTPGGPTLTPTPTATSTTTGPTVTPSSTSTFGEPTQAIPTVSGVGLIALILALLGVAILYLRSSANR